MIVLKLKNNPVDGCWLFWKSSVFSPCFDHIHFSLKGADSVYAGPAIAMLPKDNNTNSELLERA